MSETLLRFSHTSILARTHHNYNILLSRDLDPVYILDPQGLALMEIPAHGRVMLIHDEFEQMKIKPIVNNNVASN